MLSFGWPFAAFRSVKLPLAAFLGSPFGRYTDRSASGAGADFGAREYPTWEGVTFPEEVRRSLKTQQHAHLRPTPRPRSVSRFDAAARQPLMGLLERRCQD